MCAAHACVKFAIVHMILNDMYSSFGNLLSKLADACLALRTRERLRAPLGAGYDVPADEAQRLAAEEAQAEHLAADEAEAEA